MKRGFTLVEIIVSLMIFSIVAVVALSALVKIIDANKKAQTTQDAVTELSFALDGMSRDMRSGSSYYCNVQSSVSGNMTLNLFNPASVNNCSGGLSSAVSGAQSIVIAFASANTITGGSGSPCRAEYAYRLRRVTNSSYWSIDKSEQTACSIGTHTVKSALNTDFTTSPGDTFSTIVSTSTNVSISSYDLNMTANTFPLFSLDLSGYAGVKAQSTSYFNVQTADSPRVP